MWSSKRIVLAAIACLCLSLPAKAQSLGPAIDAAIQPHVANRDFAGAVLVTSGGDIVFDKAYGSADIARNIQNTTATSFHIGALSEAWTAAIAMHLVEKGSLRLDNSVAQFIADFPGGERITVRDLLEGKPDPETAYRALARIVAQQSAASFGEALNALLFAPYWMDGAGIDNDDLEPGRRYALGYVPDGAGGLKRADTLRWSERAGDASLFATTRDELRFVNLLFGDSLLAPETRAQMFGDANPSFGYGWQRRDDPALGGRVYSMAGQAGGFSAFVLHVPARDVTVILLGNVGSSASRSLGEDIAALVRSGS